MDSLKPIKIKSIILLVLLAGLVSCGGNSNSTSVNHYQGKKTAGTLTEDNKLEVISTAMESVYMIRFSSIEYHDSHFAEKKLYELLVENNNRIIEQKLNGVCSYGSVTALVTGDKEKYNSSLHYQSCSDDYSDERKSYTGTVKESVKPISENKYTKTLEYLDFNIRNNYNGDYITINGSYSQTIDTESLQRVSTWNEVSIRANNKDFTVNGKLEGEFFTLQNSFVDGSERYYFMDANNTSQMLEKNLATGEFSLYHAKYGYFLLDLFIPGLRPTSVCKDGKSLELTSYLSIADSKGGTFVYNGNGCGVEPTPLEGYLYDSL